MASILDKYGIKEVCDFTFYEISEETGNPTNPVLYLDTLKVSTVEQSGDESEARGGKGNSLLLIWDTNKELTVNLEDALFSAKSMAIMFGNGRVKSYSGEAAYIMRTEQFIATAEAASLPTAGTSSAGWEAKYEGPDGKLYPKVNPKFYDEKGEAVNTLKKGTKYFCTYDLKVENGSVIEISANTFPGVYYCTGDTFARSQLSGKDEAFQLIIPKAKVQSENTITMEADGDPSTFNMNLRVMRGDDGSMMKLVKYSLADGAEPSESESANLIHNHTLNPVTQASG